jgi:hypothetical protein
MPMKVRRILSSFVAFRFSPMFILRSRAKEIDPSLPLSLTPWRLKFESFDPLILDPLHQIISNHLLNCVSPTPNMTMASLEIAPYTHVRFETSIVSSLKRL